MQHKHTKNRKQKTQQEVTPSSRQKNFLLIASASLLSLFAPLAWWIHRHPVLHSEVTLTRKLQKKRSRPIRSTVALISALNSALSINILAFPVSIFLWWKRFRLEALMLVGSITTSHLFRVTIQHLVNRPRPEPLLVHVMRKPHGKSFPSGHVLTSTTFWGWLLALKILLLKKANKRQNALVSIPLLCLPSVGFARIYLGDHWASDVLGGYLLGGSWLGLTLRLYLALKNRGILEREAAQH